MPATEVTELMPDSTCYLCLQDREMQAVITSLLVRIVQQLNPMASSDVADLVDEAKCFLCLGPREQLAVQTSLLMSIATTGCGGVHIDTVDPVADPGVVSQIWINRVSGQMWYWDDGASAWVIFIA